MPSTFTNDTQISINDTTAYCQPYSDYFLGNCPAFFMLKENEADYDVSPRIAIDAIHSSFYGWRAFSYIPSDQNMNTSHVYNLTESSLMIRTRSTLDSHFEPEDFLPVFGFGQGGYYHSNSVSFSASRLLCDTCTIQPFVTNDSSTFFAPISSTPLTNNTEFARQIRLMDSCIGSVTFDRAKISRISMVGDISCAYYAQTLHLTDSRFNDSSIYCDVVGAFDCRNSTFLRTLDMSGGYGDWTIPSRFILESGSSEFRLSACSFLDLKPDFEITPSLVFPNLLLLSNGLAPEFSGTDNIVDRLGVVSQVPLLGNITVQKLLFSYAKKVTIAQPLVVKRRGAFESLPFEFYPSENQWQTSVINATVASSSSIMFTASTNVSMVRFSNFANFTVRVDRPSSDTGIFFIGPEFSIIPQRQYPTFWLPIFYSTPGYQDWRTDVVHEPSSPHINIQWPPSFTPLADAPSSYPLFSYPPHFNITSLQNSQSLFNLSFVRNSLEYPSSSTGVRYTTSATNAPPNLPHTVPTPTAPTPICTNPPTSSVIFACSTNNTWITNSSVTTPITVNTPITVHGDFTPPKLTINGLNSTITVDGCVSSLPTTVVVNLSPDDLKALLASKYTSKDLVNSNCSVTDGQKVNVQVTSVGGSKRPCQRLTGTLQSSGTSLIGTFRVDSSKCDVWWIVLVAVIGGVLLLILVLVLIFAFFPPARRCIRPFLKRNEARKSTRKASMQTI